MKSSDIGSPFNYEPEQRQDDLQALQDAVKEDPELEEALDQLIFCLEHSFNKGSDDIAYETFGDRVKSIIFRNKYRHEDDNWEHA